MPDFVTVEAGVRQLHARYADAVWRRDWDAFADCWTEDGEWRIGGATIRGREEIGNSIGQFMAKYARVLMTFRTPMLEIGDRTAAARTYVDERNRTVEGGFVNSIGCYYERLELGDDGQWRRAWALFELLYLGPADLTGAMYEVPDYGRPPGMPPLDTPTFPHRRPTP